jgi:hypothetical protein
MPLKSTHPYKLTENYLHQHFETLNDFFASPNLVQADTIKLTYYTHHTHAIMHTQMTCKLDLQLIQYMKQFKVHIPQNTHLNLGVKRIHAQELR